MEARRKLWSAKNLYDLPATDALFVEAMREIVGYHQKNTPGYSCILQKEHFSLSQLNDTEDLAKIPPLPTLFLKDAQMTSLAPHPKIMTVTTSGTSGKKGFVDYDPNTGMYSLWSASRILWDLGLFSKTPHNYIILAPKPSRKNAVGLARSASSFSMLTPVIHKEYALIETKNGTKLNVKGILRALKRYAKEPFPVRLIGLPAFHWILLNTLKKLNLRLKLPKNSLLCLSGGWKQFHFENANKQALYALAEEYLDIPIDRCMDFFGAVEHPILYHACKNGFFHIPIYSRVFIRHPQNLSSLGFGEAGILNLLTPLMKTMPFHSIMTDDLAVLYPENTCTCGNPSAYFKLMGRAGLPQLKTCAADISSMIAR